MKKRVYIYLSGIVLTAGLCISFSGMLYGQCLNVPNGQWPSGTTGFTPTCSGNELITPVAWTGEYSRVNVTSGVQYTFSSSVSTDFITISDIDGLSALAWGVTPVIWTAPFSGQIRFNLHNASDCTSETVARSRYILCGTPPSLVCPGDLGLGTVFIASLPYSATGLTNCGNGNNITSSNAFVCGSAIYYGGEDKTFIFTPTVTGMYDIVFTTTSSYSGLMLYSGCPFLAQGGTCVAQSQSFTGNKTLSVALTAGVTYYLVVDSWPFPSCHTSFNLNITPPILPCSPPGTPTSSVVGATSATINWSAAPGATLYRYSFGTGSHTCGSGSMTTSNTSVSLSGLIPNTTYTFCVRTDACGAGTSSSYMSNTFTTQPLPNDNCSGSILVSCNQTVNGSTIGATTDSGLGACGVGTGGTPGIGIWYRLNGDGSQVTLNLCNSNYDTKVHVYEGSSCGSLTCVASSDDSGICTPSTRSHLIFNTNAGSTYYILVSGFSASTGSFSMQIECVCDVPLGTPWTSSGIGSASGEAIDNVCGGSIDLSGTGPAFSNADNIYYSRQTICGDQTITVKVVSISNGGHAGLMFRESTAPGSRMVSISTQLTYIILRRARAMTNGNAQSQQIMRFGHNYLRLVRTGNIFQGFTSPNGNQWFIAFQVTIPLPTCVDAGIFVHGLNQASTATAVFQDLQMSGGQAPPTMGNNPYTGVSTDSPMTAFPNPASEQLNLKTGDLFLGQDLEITVINSIGQIVKSIEENNLQSDVLTLDVRDLTSGVYFLNLIPGNGSPYIQRFVIAR